MVFNVGVFVETANERHGLVTRTESPFKRCFRLPGSIRNSHAKRGSGSRVVEPEAVSLLRSGKSES